MSNIKVAFLGREGSLIRELPNSKHLNRVEQIDILPGVVDGLQNLLLKEYRLVMVTNQDGLGTRSNPSKNFNTVQAELLGLLEIEGIKFFGVFVCPHFQHQWCLCRKPRTGLVESFIREHPIDYYHSLVIGNSGLDTEFAMNLNLSFIRMEMNGRFPTISLG